MQTIHLIHLIFVDEIEKEFPSEPFEKKTNPNW